MNNNDAYFIYSFDNRNKFVGCFMPAKTMARLINQPYFGGFVVKDKDLRSFAELKAAEDEWISGLEALDGGHGAILIRGADLYPTYQAAEAAILENMPAAETKSCRDSQINFYYDAQSKKFIPKTLLESNEISELFDDTSKTRCCIIL
jgi:hypothetical protein